MKNATPVGELRPTGRLQGRALLAHIPNHFDIAIRRGDGSLALKVDCVAARALAKSQLVTGHVVNGVFRYLVLDAPKSTVIRALRMEPARPGDVTVAKPSDMQWPTRLDRAHCGRMGGLKRVWTRT